jgi:predicted methyltransferase
MMKQLATIALAAMLCAGLVASASDDWSALLEDPERVEWQKPSLVLKFMGVEKGQTVAAIGTESGLFLRSLSRKTGQRGVVYFVSSDKAALEYLRNLEDRRLHDHIITLLAGPDDPALPESEIDHLLLVNSLRTVKKRGPYLKKLARALKPNGRLTIIDWQSGDIEMAPPEVERLSRERVVAELTKARWSLVTESVALPYQYLLVFHPPGAK